MAIIFTLILAAIAMVLIALTLVEFHIQRRTAWIAAIVPTAAFLAVGAPWTFFSALIVFFFLCWFQTSRREYFEWLTCRYHLTEYSHLKTPMTPREWFEDSIRGELKSEHFPRWHEDEKQFILTYRERQIPVPHEISEAIVKCMTELFNDEQFVPDLPEKPPIWFRWNKDKLNARRVVIKDHLFWLANHKYVLAHYKKMVTDILDLYKEHLPPHFCRPATIDVPISEALQKPTVFMSKLMKLFENRELTSTSGPFYNTPITPLFYNLKRTFNAHKYEVGATKKRGKEPTDYPKEEILNLVDDYFRNTPLERLFHVQVPFAVPENMWEEHGLIVGGSGQGKSQLLEALILQLINQDAEHGMVVIDTKSDINGLFNRLSRLKLFHPDTGDLYDRLTIIDPTDHPAFSLLKSEGDGNTLIQFIGSLPGTSEFTSRQRSLLGPALTLMGHMPEANLSLLLELIDHPTNEKFKHAIALTKSDFWGNYDPKRYNLEREGITWRVNLIREDPILGPMFNAPTCNFSMRRAVKEGQIVLIHLPDGFLEPEIIVIIARYFTQLFFKAVTSRHADAYRIPVHLIVDEALDLIDESTEKNFGKLRSLGGCCLYAVLSAKRIAGQWDIIGQSTSIKFAGGVEDVDIRLLQNYMRCTVDFLAAQKKQRPIKPDWVRFGCYLRNLSDRAFSCFIPTGQLDAAGFMSDVAYRHLRTRNRERVSIIEQEPRDQYVAPSERAPRHDPDSTKPSTSY